MNRWYNDSLFAPRRTRGAASLQREFDRMFAPFYGARLATSEPRAVFNVRETDEAYFVEAELPAFGRDDIEVTFEDGYLTISGKRELAVPEGYEVVRRERASESFERRVRFRDAIDTESIGARFEDGVLTVTLQRAEPPKARRIELS